MSSHFGETAELSSVKNPHESAFETLEHAFCPSTSAALLLRRVSREQCEHIAHHACLVS